jgi:hypothetical protein
MREIDKKLKRKIGALFVLGLFAILILSTIGIAQSWGTGGSETVSYPIIIDSDDSSTDEVFAVLKDHTSPSSAIELFRVQENGDVGIGDTTPSHKLEIVDTDSTSGRNGLKITQSGAQAGTGYGIKVLKTGDSNTNLGGHFSASGADTNYGSYSVTESSTGSPTNNIAGYFSATSATNNYGLLVANGRVGIGDITPDFKLEVTGSSGSGYFGVTSSSDGDIFIIDSNGDVGIGTITPNQKLEVLDSSTQLRLSNNAATTFTDFTVDSNHDLLIKTSSNGQIKLQPTTDSTDFFQVLDDRSSVIMNVDASNERVGIGISDPAAKLEIAGNILFDKDADRTISLQTPTSSHAGYKLTISPGDAFDTLGTVGYAGGDLVLHGGAGDGGISTGNGGNVYLYGGTPDGEATRGDVIMLHDGSIKLGGEVGIGTNSPDEKFEIEWGSASIDFEVGQGTTDMDITFITLRNADGEKCYIYPNADQDGIIVSSSKP